MFCPQCGYQVPEGAQFCPACGNTMTAKGPQHRRAANQPANQAQPYGQPNQSAGVGASVQSNAAVGAGAPAQPNAYSALATNSVPAQPNAYSAPAQPSAPMAYGAAAAPAAFGVRSAQGGQSLPGARRGIKTLYHSQMLMFISAALTLILGMVTIGSGYYSGASDLTVGLAGATGIAGIVMAVLMIVAFIMRIVGCFRAGKDEKTFLFAAIVTLVGVACNIFIYVLYYQAISSYDYSMIEMTNTIQYVVTFATLIAYVLMIYGVSAVAKRIGRQDITTMAIVLLVIAAAAYLVTSFVPTSSMPIYIIKLVCAFVPDVALLVCFIRGNKMFA